GQDLRVAILSYRSLGSWRLGYPEAAVVDSDQALKDAREIGHPITLIYALWHAALTQTECKNYPKASALLDEAIALADEKGAVFWKALATVSRGCVFALIGDASKAIQVTTTGLIAYRSTGATVFLPNLFSCLAWAYAELGQFDDAWRCVNEATTVIQTTKEALHEAEVNCIAGEIALLSREPDAGKAEAYFERALAVARKQQAKSLELRAAMSMARLWRDQGKRDE